MILGLAGLRAAEAVAVRRGDLVDGVLHIRRSAWGRTKTGRTRSLTLPPGEVQALRRFLARESERLFALGIRADDATTILTSSTGEAIQPARLGHAFRAYAREHGIDATYHSLRHTAASMMMASGIDVRTVAGRLGHARASTTLNTYSHLLGAADRDAAERLDEILKRTPDVR